jgi:HEXXH motif-containing protein
MRYHRLADPEFAALATGLGGAAAIRKFEASRRSRHLLLLRYVTDRWAGRRADLDAAIELLAAAQRRAPDTFGRIMSDPMVGAWLGHTSRRLRDGDEAEPLAPDLLHLGAVAAAAALRCGVDGRATGYARRGRIALPTLGAIALPAGVDAPVSILVTGDRVTVSGPPGEAAVRAADEGDGRWLGLRELTAEHDGRAVAVRLDDGDPYRDRYHAPAADRLGAAEVRHWREMFAQAWGLLGRHLPDRAQELADGLRVLVPLTDKGDGSSRSATVNDSLAAFGLTRPTSAADLVVTMVHEFQHSKLTALGQLVGLYEPRGTERHFAPWRSDARPTPGLVQGVYAFLGVADAWRALRAEPALAEAATAQFATVREQVRVALDALESSRELTGEGRGFTLGLRAAVDRLLAVPVPGAALAAARAAVRDRRAEWERDRGP